MIETKINDSNKMRTIEDSCCISRAVPSYYGEKDEFLCRNRTVNIDYSSRRVMYIPKCATGELCSDGALFAEYDFDDEIWILTDRTETFQLRFAEKTKMTKYVKSHFARNQK